ncbi:MAG: methyltransferase domain-containing protein [Chitinophagales bacterium]|nr:methyltransferase domain-containing protein [Chitinophagales bacterium]
MEWFESWFDSPYYHILYQHRNDHEAQHFLDNLRKVGCFASKDRILDLACGKGRHAAYLAKMDMEVTGLDLSPQSIAAAIENFGTNNPEFYIHDMRLPFRINYYNFIGNFFTSFGYFNRIAENERVIKAMTLGLKKDGKLLIDFFNAKKVIAHLVEHETKTLNGIHFSIHRKYTNGLILKDIDFEDHGQHFHFQEKVQALQPDDFRMLAARAGLTIQAEYGNYDLEAYHAHDSDRYILVAVK